MKWQKMAWPPPADIRPRDRQTALYYYGDDQYTRVYWDDQIKDFRFAEDVAHIYGGKEATYIMLVEPPEQSLG